MSSERVIKVHWHWPASIRTELRPDGRMRATRMRPLPLASRDHRHQSPPPPRNNISITVWSSSSRAACNLSAFFFQQAMFPHPTTIIITALHVSKCSSKYPRYLTVCTYNVTKRVTYARDVIISQYSNWAPPPSGARRPTRGVRVSRSISYDEPAESTHSMS